MTIYEIINKISNGGMDELFSQVYSESDSEILRQRARYLNCAENFSRLYPLHEEIHIFSVPGRVEIGGNHTAQQHGNVLAAAVTPDILGFVAYHNENVVRIFSKDFEHVEIDLSDLSDIAEKYSGYGALTAEIISEFAAKGIICSGFDAYIMSDIPVESGFSSSMAFEIFIGNIINNSSDKRLSEIEIAKIGHFVEQKYMEKEIGLESYLICAIGGIAAFELNYPHNPVIRRLDFDFSKSGYSVCLVGVGENNENFTDTYKEILYDMKSVAKAIDVDYLGDADEDDFYRNIAEIRNKCSDRAINRAIHFYEENKRVLLEIEALKGGRVYDFMQILNSSWEDCAMLIHQHQGLALALSISRRYLNGSGAVRVHGGYVISFVPDYMVGNYIKTLDNIFGQGSTKAMKFRKGAAGELYV